MKIVVMAGGRGTRIEKINSELPKPMIPVNGKPVLEYQLEIFREQGYKDFIFVTGYLSDKIIHYFGDGSRFGTRIEYYIESEPLGTAGALYDLRDRLKEDFILILGDIIADIDLDRLIRAHKRYGGLVTLFTHPNDHPYDSGIVMADSDMRVIKWIAKEDERGWYKNRVNAGIHVISPGVFDACRAFGLFQERRKLDLDRDILKNLIASGDVYAYDSPEYVKDMGTPERYEQVSADLRAGLVSRRNLKNKQKAIFLDRDGTINQYVGFLRNIDDFALTDTASEAIRLIHQAGYLAIVITNQPVIARGEMTFEQLEEVHNKMETLLGRDGAFLDKIYFCPHHPHKGFAGEIAELKFECECRKPKPGLISQAARDFNIDLKKSWMIGDSQNDIMAGKAAGCGTALIGDLGSITEKADFYGSDLLDCVKQCVRAGENAS